MTKVEAPTIFLYGRLMNSRLQVQWEYAEMECIVVSTRVGDDIHG